MKENTTNRYDPKEEDNVYMNETCSSGIPLEKLDSIVAKQGTKEYNDFKKEYAVRHFFLFVFFELLSYFDQYYYLFLFFVVCFFGVLRPIRGFSVKLRRHHCQILTHARHSWPLSSEGS